MRLARIGVYDEIVGHDRHGKVYAEERDEYCVNVDEIASVNFYSDPACIEPRDRACMWLRGGYKPLEVDAVEAMRLIDMFDIHDVVVVVES